jgi:hypothetical protein
LSASELKQMLSSFSEEQEKEFAKIIDRITKSTNELFGKDSRAYKRWLEWVSKFKL